MGSRGAHCGHANCPAGGIGHWSHMTCNDADRKIPHQHHTWNSEYMVYGPYLCEGYGMQVPPPDPPKQQYTNDPIHADIIDWSEESIRERADLSDGDDVWERTVSYSKWERMPRD